MKSKKFIINRYGYFLTLIIFIAACCFEIINIISIFHAEVKIFLILISLVLPLPVILIIRKSIKSKVLTTVQFDKEGIALKQFAEKENLIKWANVIRIEVNSSDQGKKIRVFVSENGQESKLVLNYNKEISACLRKYYKAG